MFIISRIHIVYSVFMLYTRRGHRPQLWHTCGMARRTARSPPAGVRSPPSGGGRSPPLSPHAPSGLYLSLISVPNTHTSVPPRPRLPRVGGVVEVKSNSWAPMWLQGRRGQCQVRAHRVGPAPSSVPAAPAWHGGQGSPLCARQRAWLQGRRCQCQVRAQALSHRMGPRTAVACCGLAFLLPGAARISECSCPPKALPRQCRRPPSQERRTR